MLLRRLIGLALRRARQRQGLTLRQVATAARVSVAYLSEVERGRKEASSEVLAAVCKALGMHLADLLDDVRDDLSGSVQAGPAPRPTPVLPGSAASGPGQLRSRAVSGPPARPTRRAVAGSGPASRTTLCAHRPAVTRLAAATRAR